MKKEDKIEMFWTEYKPSSLFNRLSYMMIYKGILPFKGSKLVYSPQSKYTLTYKPIEYMEEDHELIIIEDMDPLLDVLMEKDRRKRAALLFDKIRELLIV